MKKHLITLLFLLVASAAFSQVTKCKTTSFAYKQIDEVSGEWTDWTDWTDLEILVVIDSENDRIKIYSKEDQIYDIIKYEGESIDEDGDETIEWLCVNEEGLKCAVRIMKLHSEDGSMHLYVDFSNLMFVYNIYGID